TDTLEIAWEYYDGSQYIKFTPTLSDDFCTLLEKSPLQDAYRLTITGPITLQTKYGVPREKTYESYLDNNGIEQPPEKKYLIKIDADTCRRPPSEYAKFKLGILSGANNNDIYKQLVNS